MIESPKPAPSSARVAHVSVANLPTEFGEFRIHVFTTGDAPGSEKEHVAMVRGDLTTMTAIPTRLHSECMTGDVMGSLRCDCREQLHRGLRDIGALPCGVLLYLRQEGRGIGLANKVRAYGLQEAGLDTVDANLALGFRDDERDYGIAAAMLGLLGVGSIRLMTNNPDKVEQLRRYGVNVVERVPHLVEPGRHNRHYLETKARRSGHLMTPVSPVSLFAGVKVRRGAA